MLKIIFESIRDFPTSLEEAFNLIRQEKKDNATSLLGAYNSDGGFSVNLG